MSATEEKIAHDKWVRDLKDNKVKETVHDAKGCIKWGSLILSQPENSFKRLQLI